MCTAISRFLSHTHTKKFVEKLTSDVVTTKYTPFLLFQFVGNSIHFFVIYFLFQVFFLNVPMFVGTPPDCLLLLFFVFFRFNFLFILLKHERETIVMIYATKTSKTH